MKIKNQESNILVEACVETLQESIHAEQRGADRLELCADLHLDGLTPDIHLIREVLEAVRIPVKVMIRPRGGDFVYNNDEFDAMLEAIVQCKQLGIKEIVTGILLPDHTLDIKRLQVLSHAAKPMSVTIHKCIDLVPDIFEAIEQLKEIPGVQSILSSGYATTALEGGETLKTMRYACGERLTLIVAGKVTPENLNLLHEKIGAHEYHGRRIV